VNKCLLPGLRPLRHEQGLTQEALARVVGCTRANVAQWERGTSSPTIAQFRRLVDIFDTSSDVLLYWRGEAVAWEVA